MSAVCQRHGVPLDGWECAKCAVAREKAAGLIRPNHETVWAFAVVSGVPAELVKVEDGEETCYLVRCYGPEGGRARWPVSYSAPYITRLWEEITGDSLPAHEWHKGRLA